MFDNEMMIIKMINARMTVLIVTSLTVVASFLVYANTDSSLAQNQTQQDNQTEGPLAQLSGRAQDVFNGTNQTGGPIAEFGETIQETFN